MLDAIIGISLTAIGFVVTEKNAKYLLAGYNTVSNEDRGKFDLKSFLHEFKKFHIPLGISLLTIGLILTLLISESVAAVFLGVYPVVAYLYFLWKSNKKLSQNKKNVKLFTDYKKPCSSFDKYRFRRAYWLGHRALAGE